MTHRDLQALRAELAHLETYLERHTTLPLTEVRMEQELLQAEERLGANLDDALRLLRGAFRAADLLGIDVLGHLHDAERHVRSAQAVLTERRSDD